MFRKNPKFQHQQPASAKNELKLTEDDLLDQLALKKGSGLFMGAYSVEQIEAVCERSGLFPNLRKQGFTDFRILIEPLEDFSQALKFYSKFIDADHLLGELRVREVKIDPPEAMADFFDKEPRMLAMDWLLMQNPFRAFSPERLRLPGQEHPGLGQARKVLKILLMFCRLRRLSGLLNFPEYFHNAAIYQYAFHFYSPEQEALLTSLPRDLHPLDLAEMSWAIEWNCVRDLANSTIFEWQPGSQILPIAPGFHDYLVSDSYSVQVHGWCNQQKFELDKNKFEFMWQREFEEIKHV